MSNNNHQELEGNSYIPFQILSTNIGDISHGPTPDVLLWKEQLKDAIKEKLGVSKYNLRPWDVFKSGILHISLRKL